MAQKTRIEPDGPFDPKTAIIPDRGAAMVEYAVLLGGVAIMLLVSLQVVGGTVNSALMDLQISESSPTQESQATADAAVFGSAGAGSSSMTRAPGSSLMHAQTGGI